MEPAGVKEAIAHNENRKRLTDLLEFYSNAKDTLTAWNIIESIKQAATIGKWNNTRKCAEFCHLLHTDERGFISQILKKAKTPNDDWTAHKKLFLDFYDIKGAAKFNFFVLHELKQTPSEKVRDFFTRV